MKTRHFEPSFISCSASVQPRMTPVHGETGRLPAIDRAVKDSSVDRCAVIVDDHRVARLRLFAGPSLRTRYCKPLAVVFTPGFLAFAARNCSPCCLLLSAFEGSLSALLAVFRLRLPRAPGNPTVCCAHRDDEPASTFHKTPSPTCSPASVRRQLRQRTLLHLQQLDLEDQRLVGTDFGRGASLAIGQLGRE